MKLNWKSQEMPIGTLYTMLDEFSTERIDENPIGQRPDVESIDKQIEERKDIPNETNPVEMDINFKLLRTYFKLTSKVGTKMQDAIDDLKTQLDILEDK